MTELLDASAKVKAIADERRRVVAQRFGYFVADRLRRAGAAGDA